MSYPAMQNSRPHVALLASPGMGHLIPVLELGNRLITDHNFQITVFVVSTNASTAKSLLNKSPYPTLTIVALPTVDISTLVHPSDHIVTKVAILMRESMSNLRSSISNMESKPTALIVDLFGIEAFPIADEFNMLKYIFFTSNVWFLAVTIHAPVGKKNMEEHVYHKKPLQLPGCRPVRYEDAFVEHFDMESRVYGEYVRIGKGIPMADGILVNTWDDFDTLTIESLRDKKQLGKVVRAPIYLIGPLYRAVVEMTNHVIEWLDTQPIKSVIYISFGSGGTLSTQQTEELAWGLELSKQRFVWVFRPPVDDDVSGSFFTTSNEPAALQAFLPNGFFTRTRGLGLVVPMWAPQTEILAHRSIGGFLTHCGWNSTLESIMNEVPMIAWPLYAEQKMNATQLAEDHKVAIKLEKHSMDGVIGRDEIAKRMVKIMEENEGESMRERVNQLKNSAEKAISKGGTSHNSLSKFVKECEHRSFAKNFIGS